MQRGGFGIDFKVMNVVMRGIGKQILSLSRGDMEVQEKQAFWDIRTRADKEISEKVLVEHLNECYQEDGIIGEEGANKPSRSGFVHRLDPLDGTTDFLHGLPFFGISDGYGTVDGVPVAGAIYFPSEDKFYFAHEGRGAYSDDGTSLQTNASGTLKQRVIAVGTTPGHHEVLAKLIPRCMNVLRFGSFTYEAMLVAKGNLGAVVHTGATPFDIAGAVVIAAESGCLVSPIDLRHDKIPIVIAANREIFDEVREICEI